MKISYITGDQYCILLIPRQKADQLEIANSNEVRIKTTEHGIVLEKENAGALNTSEVRLSYRDLIHVQLGASQSVKV